VYTLHPAAVKRRAILVFIGSKCYVATTAAVEHLLDQLDRQQQEQHQEQHQDAQPPVERVGNSSSGSSTR
jgi:hypothetical protein